MQLRGGKIMDKKLYLEIDSQMKEQREIYNSISDLEKFLDKHERNFRKHESIEALKRIKEFLVKRKEEYDSVTKILRKNQVEFYHTCQHEILVSRYETYECCFCGNWFKSEDINFDSILIDNDGYGKDMYLSKAIEESIFKVWEQNKDILESFLDYFEDDKVRIYRRTK